MTITGIVAEFNPFHNGHKFLIDTAKENSDGVVCVLSGDFVQRGEPAFFDKKVRANAALSNGADLVIEIPPMWSMSGAEKFAYSAVKLLYDTNTVTRLAFGVNCENKEILEDIADYILSKDYSDDIKKELKNAPSYAAARENIINNKFSFESSFLKDGNNILAIEYIKAVKKLNYNVSLCTVKRNGALHDSENTINNFASSTYLRNIIKSNNLSEAKKFIPDNLFELYKNSSFTDIKNISDGIIFKLRQKDSFKDLPDLREGLENRLKKCVATASNVEELLSLMQTKRYTNAAIRRLVLSAALEISNDDAKNDIPYIRVLGFNKKGEEIIKEIAKKSKLPLIINTKQIALLNGFAKETFNKQSKINDIYQLCQNVPTESGKELTFKPIKL